MSFIVENEPKSPIAEAYRTLRTNIQFSSFDKTMQVILITSTGPGEGKSTVSGNVAIAMAEEGKNVLLIDCDLRKPSIHKKFQISNKIGLSNLLVENIKFEDIALKYKENLYILTSGVIPPNPSEMLSSSKMKNFIEIMRGKFDCIILDTPPVLAVTDAQILSTIADGVLLVISSGEANRDACIKAKELLLNVNANIIGAIINKVDFKGGKSYGYSYYYYYNEDGEKHKKKKA